MRMSERMQAATSAELNEAWNGLGPVADDLEAWYCVRRQDWDTDDLRRLLVLWFEGKFRAWDCPDCGERVQAGDPDNWGHFQGVGQPDYASYPGDPANPLNEYYCDDCRGYCPRIHSEPEITI